MSNNVFTIFNHGTNFHRDSNSNELISRLSTSILGQEARVVQTGERTDQNPLPFALRSKNPTYLICEGPGSSSVTAEQSGQGFAHTHPGRLNPIFNTQKDIGSSNKLNPRLIPRIRRWFYRRRGLGTSEFQDSFMGNTPISTRARGLLLGSGWEDNVYRAVWMITHLRFELNQPIDTINIVGWSRGAVTCTMIANKLFELFEDTIDINIFAIDPVPGGQTTRTKEMLGIPPNVRNYMAILALDSDGSNFLPTDRNEMSYIAPRSQHGKTGNSESRNPTHIRPRTHFLPLPGNHSDLVNSALSSQLVENSAKLCQHLAYQFLRAHGTPFGPDLSVSTAEATQLYEAMLPKMKQIATAASTGSLLNVVQGRRINRNVRTNRQNYVHDADQFINEHHRLCTLGKNYPGGAQDSSFSSSEWRSGQDPAWLDLPAEQSDLRNMGFQTQ